MQPDLLPTMHAVDTLRDDLRETDRALFDTAGSLRELSSLVAVSQEHNERRLDKMEKLGAKLLLGVLILSGGGATVGPLILKLFGG